MSGIFLLSLWIKIEVNNCCRIQNFFRVIKQRLGYEDSNHTDLILFSFSYFYFSVFISCYISVHCSNSANCYNVYYFTFARSSTLHWSTFAHSLLLYIAQRLHIIARVSIVLLQFTVLGLSNVILFPSIYLRSVF